MTRSRPLTIASATFAIMLSIIGQASGECPHANEALEPSISTIAGIGSPGSADGLALAKASFIEPTGVAVAKDGSIYVADASAQNVRRIFHGVVTTIAGSSRPGPSPEQRVGGYVDGPAASAKFDRPTGLAIGSDGAVYVADSLNRVVRKIKNGVVSTLAKGLDSPRALAFDDDGVLYVGDHGTGVRTVSLTDGSLSPLDTISDIKARAICGLAVKGSGSNKILAFTDETTIHISQGAEKRDIQFDDRVEPVFEEQHIGAACAIHILDRDNIIVSDVLDNSVKLVRLALGGVVAEPPVARALTSGRKLLQPTFGGFADGPASIALSDLPGDFATLQDGSIVFADSGNRRVRRIRGIDVRQVVSPGTSSTLEIPTASTRNYRIAFVGNSFAFTDALWMDSIPGQIEQGLIRRQEAVGLKKCPDVVAYRLSGSTVMTAADFVSENYGDGQADLVIFMIDAYNVQKDIESLAKSPPGSSVGTLAPSNYSTGWRELLPKRLRLLRDELSKNGTKLAIVTIPDGRAVSNLENVRSDLFPDQWRDLYNDEAPGYFTFKIQDDVDRLFRKTGIHTVALLRSLITAEEGTVRAPLFGTEDEHPSPAGNIMIGKLLTIDLESWRPWANGI